MKNPWLTILTYLILGPPIGLILVLGFTKAQYGGRLLPFEHVGFILAGAYIFGGLPAIAAGIGVVGLRVNSAQSFWRVALVGIVVGIISAIVWSLANNWGNNVTLGPRLWRTAQVAAFLSALCAFSTIGCWLVVRLCDIWSTTPQAKS
jgi:hypothetical protein